jgi:RNA polymerase sigma-70 factor (ECF subfamily)
MSSDLEAAVIACIPQLRRYARGLCRDAASADDLVQDTLERAWQKLSLWQRRSDVRAWMFGIMHNRFVDVLRARTAKAEEPEGEFAPEPVDMASPDDGLVLRDIDRALHRLPPELREVLLLVGVECMSYKEVAQVLDVPLGTVMSRLSRARERLRAELAGESWTEKLQRVK